MCMCRPTRSSPCSSSFLKAPSRFSCQIPCLLVGAAGVRLAGVAVAEAGVHAQPDGVAAPAPSQLVEHVLRAGVHGDAEREDPIECRAVDHVRGVDQLGRLPPGLEARAQRPLDLAEGDRVHQRALLAHQPQDVQVRAGLLRVAHHVEGGERADALADHLRGVDVAGRAEALGQAADSCRVDALHLRPRIVLESGEVPHPRRAGTQAGERTGSTSGGEAAAW